jgi:hypothetical protein
MVRFAAPLVLFLWLLNCSTPVLAQPDVEIGLRAIGLVGDGRPANSIGGVGLAARYYLDDGWLVAATLDRYHYVFRQPGKTVGPGENPIEETLNSAVHSTVLAGEIGRHYGRRWGFDWFWSVGIGVGFPETTKVPLSTVAGPGHDLKIDAKTEILMMGAIGTSYYLSDRWSISSAFRVDYSFLDMSVIDQLNDAVGRIDSQGMVGAYLSINAALF